MSSDPPRRQNFDFVTLISCDNSPQNALALGPDHDRSYVLTPKIVLRANPTLSELEQIPSEKSPSTFTVQEAGIFSNDELTKVLESCFTQETLSYYIEIFGRSYII